MPKKRPTHLDEHGNARMVDVGDKEVTKRRATATGSIRMKPETLDAAFAGTTKKGDVLAVARIAGIQAGKETSRWIPLCHPLGLDNLNLDFERVGDDTLQVTGTASVTAKTGVEMEALTAVTGALLTVYDMLKGMDRGMEIFGVHLERKEGGRSGVWEWGT